MKARSSNFSTKYSTIVSIKESSGASAGIDKRLLPGTGVKLGYLFTKLLYIRKSYHRMTHWTHDEVTCNNISNFTRF